MNGRSRLMRAGTLRRSPFYNNIRQQLNEQLKCLDVRVDTQVSLVAEIQDYFRRRAEVELEYSRSLEKLAKSLMLRHKAEKQKREQWHLFSSYACWQHLVSSTRRQSRDHAVISEIYANSIISRMSCIMEDVQRIYKRCREIGIEIHEELLKVLHELHVTMKTYHTYHTEEKQAEGKLRYVEAQKTKLEQSIPKEKLERSKKFRVIEKEVQKRRSKYNDAKLKALKARNDYLLCMDAANAAVHRYFVDDLSDTIDCMDFGFHTSLAQSFMVSISAEECLKKSQQSIIDGMNKCITNLDSRVDKQRFLEYNNSAFMVPKKFEFQPHKNDEMTQVAVEKPIQDDLEQRFELLATRLSSLRTEGEEIWKTLETAEKTLLNMLSTKDYDVSPMFDEENCNKNSMKQPETLTLKRRADKQETEDFYLNKFSEYTMTNNMIARLQAKADLIEKALGLEKGEKSSLSVGSSPAMFRPHNLPQRVKKKRIGRTPQVGQPKLFGGSLEEYLEATNQEIPLIIKSCIRIINLYGLHHQGIFRVSGSQVEINNFREAFERGDDPLAEVTDASDINSVGGVLKLYLRELREPLFPIFYFDQLVDISQVESKHEFILKVKDVINNLPRPVVVVLRYLFAFLNHLSEFSDENMMDPYNLAICFGPTLLPIPEDKDQVQYQNLVNELVKNIIIYQEEIYPADDGGIVYEKYISANIPDENDVGDSPPEPVSDLAEDCEMDLAQSEDDAVFPDQELDPNLFGKTEVLEAVAQFDFNARSARELSFKRGDTLFLQSQVSNDWWRGSHLGKEGLVPDKYILLKIRDEDKEKNSIDGTERRRASSSSDSLSGVSQSPKSLSTSGIPEDYSSTSSLDRRSLNSLQPPSTPEWDATNSLSSSELTLQESEKEEKRPIITKPSELPDLEIIHDTPINRISNPEKIEERIWTNKTCKDAPDLVLDLPINLPSPVTTVKEIKNSLADSFLEDHVVVTSPNIDSPELTTAERFAKSNQCTMKKGTMSRSASHVTSQSNDAQTQTIHGVRRSASTGDNLGPPSPDSGIDSKENLLRPSETELSPSPAQNHDAKMETVEISWSYSTKKQDPNTGVVEIEVPDKKDATKNKIGGGVSTFKPQVKSKPPPVMKKPVHVPPTEIKPPEEYQQTAC